MNTERMEHLLKAYISQVKTLGRVVEDAESAVLKSKTPPRSHSKELMDAAIRLHVIAEQYMEASRNG